MKLDRILTQYQQSSPDSRKWNGETSLDIAIAAVASVIPALGLAVTLMVIVYQNRLGDTSSQATLFNTTLSNDYSGVYYINFSATRLTTVASWASSAALFLPGSVMSLYWYRIAASMQQKSRKGDMPQLPTPYQYSLLLALRSGGIPALWEWLTHRWSRRRQRQNPLVSSAGNVLALVILIGVLIGAADTWLHVTTETVNFEQVTPNGVLTQRYGRQLPRDCALGTINGVNHSCAIEVPSSGPDYLINPSEVYQVLSDQSTNNKVLTTQFNDQRLSYLGPSATQSTLDFEATTIASHSQCQSATQRCHAATSGYYNCSAIFNNQTSEWYLSRANGNIISLGIFPDTNYTAMGYTTLPNPFYTISQVTILSASNSGRGIDAITLPNGGREFFVGCTTSFYNLTYSSVNGTIAALGATPVTDPHLVYSLAEINVQGRSGYAEGQILGGALTAFHEDTSDAANEAFASQYDATFLAAAASVIESVPNTAEQTRSTLLVARVKISALLALVGALLVSALLGILMTFLAISHGLSRDTSSVRPRSLQGEEDLLQVSMLDSGSRPDPPRMEDVFDEYVRAGRTDRLGVLKTKQEGWIYVCSAPEQQSPEVAEQQPPRTSQRRSRRVSEQKTPEPKSPEEDVKNLHHGVFGIPLVTISSPRESLSGSMHDVSDEESWSEELHGGRVSGRYQALQA